MCCKIQAEYSPLALCVGNSQRSICLWFGGNMYNPKFWKHCENITVKQFCDYIRKNVPEDAALHVCGDNHLYMHLEADGSVFSVDDNSLSDLPEYEGWDVEDVML